MHQRLKEISCFTTSLAVHTLLLLVISILYTQSKSSGNSDGNGPGSGGRPPNDRSGVIMPGGLKNVTKVKIIEKEQDMKGTIIVKKIPKPRKKVKKMKRGYYGIGVYIATLVDRYVIFNGQTYMGEMLSTVINGNPAAEAGLQPGDVIFMIDGQALSGSKEQIVGDGPKYLTLMVERNGVIFSVKLKRDWVNLQD